MFVRNIERLKKTKISYIFRKTFVFVLFAESAVMNIKKIFKKEESIEILKILGLISNTEEYQKIQNQESRI